MDVLDSMIAIGLLVLANFILMLARKRKRGFLRFTLSFLAFSMLFPAFLFALRALT
jgi:hypothetical protein